MNIRRILPNTVTGQLTLLIVATLVVAQLVNLLILIGENRLRAKATMVNYSIRQSISVLQTLPSLSEVNIPYRHHRPRQAAGAFTITRFNQVTRELRKESLISYENMLRQELDSQGIKYVSIDMALQPNLAGAKFSKNRIRDFSTRPPPNFESKRNGSQKRNKRRGIEKKAELDHVLISIEIEAGIWFNASLPITPVETLTPKILLSTVLLILITLLSVTWFMRRITRPLSDFAHAAEQFGRGNEPLHLDEKGPQDIRSAATAFNRMQRRLSRLLETQRIMLRAVGHDLKTPLTSLRIRAERISEQHQRDKFITTIDEMTLMTQDILDWAKNASGLEETAAVDMKALLTSIADDFADQGSEVTIDEMDNIVLKIRRIGLKRSITNIVSNAVKYAGDAHISIEQDPTAFKIHVDDTGKGIPVDKFFEARKPFTRLESSRNKKTGGSGLGLSIAESIIQSDGGKLIFKHLEPSGFRVTIVLPI